MTQVNILMRDIEDEKKTSILTLDESDLIAPQLMLEIAKKDDNMIPFLSKDGFIQQVVPAFESDGRPAGFRRVSAFLKP